MKLFSFVFSSSSPMLKQSFRPLLKEACLRVTLLHQPFFLGTWLELWVTLQSNSEIMRHPIGVVCHRLKSPVFVVLTNQHSSRRTAPRSSAFLCNRPLSPGNKQELRPAERPLNSPVNFGSQSPIRTVLHCTVGVQGLNKNKYK